MDPWGLLNKAANIIQIWSTFPPTVEPMTSLLLWILAGFGVWSAYRRVRKFIRRRKLQIAQLCDQVELVPHHEGIEIYKIDSALHLQVRFHLINFSTSKFMLDKLHVDINSAVEGDIIAVRFPKRSMTPIDFKKIISSADEHALSTSRNLVKINCHLVGRFRSHSIERGFTFNNVRFQPLGA